MKPLPTQISRALLAGVCLATALPAVTPVAAASADPAPAVEGTALPWRWEAALRYMDLLDQSPGYIMHTRSQYDERHGRTYSVVRVSDGTVVDTFERSYNQTTIEQPRLVDQSYVEMVMGAGYHPDHLDVHHLDDGTSTSIDISDHGGFVHGDDEWALVSDADPGAAYSVLSFVWADGHTVRASGLQVRSDLTWNGGDSDTAYVTLDGRSYAIAAATGDVTPLSLPDHSPATLYAVTADTLVAYSSHYFTDGRTGYRFTTLDRGTGDLVAQVDVPYDTKARSYLPYGRGLAAVYLPQGGSLYRFELRPLDMSTGALLPAVASSVVAAGAMGNGQVALVLGDVPTGRLAVTSGTGDDVQSVADLPQIGYRSLALGLSDGVVVSGFDGQSGLWSTQVGPAGDWEPTYPSSTPEDERSGSFAFAGDTVLTRLPDTFPGAMSHYRLAWPGGSRDLDGSAVLGRGGQYMLHRAPGSASPTEVQDVRSGTVVTSWTDTTRRLLDGTWLWTAPDAAGTMNGTDLSGGEPPRTAEVPPSCLGRGQDVLTVVGRWALAECGSGLDVIDLWGVMQPWTVPAEHGYVQLGDGFAAWVDITPDPAGGPSTITLDVAGLGVDHTVHTYGPLRGNSYPPGPGYAVDGSGSPDLVYADPSSRVRHVHLDWLQAAPLTRPDSTAPTPTSAPVLDPAVRSGRAVTVTPSWTYVDPEVPHEPASGLASFDVRYRAHPANTDTPWVEPADWQSLPDASVTSVLNPGQGRCFQARARDANGNLSEWTAPACSYVDDASPTLDAAGGSAPLVRQVVGSLTYTFGASDDYGVASYDVGVRSAARGKDLGAWQTRWTGTRRTTVSVHAGPGTERCFRFRARDVAGNTSRWSPMRCSTLPVDDSELAAKGQVARETLDIAIVGTYSELEKRGASLILPDQTGRSVAVWVIRGPYQGPVDVYAGGRRLGRIDMTARWQRRAVVQLTSAKPWSGPVRLVSVSRKPARIDALAVIR